VRTKIRLAPRLDPLRTAPRSDLVTDSANCEGREHGKRNLQRQTVATCNKTLSRTVREIETLPYQTSMRYLRGARALLVFSRTESWGRTILEAFLFEKPVIAFEPVGVLKEVPCEWVAYLEPLKGGSTGLSEDELTSIISKLNSNSTARRIWTQNRNEEYRARWSRIISDSV